MFFDAIYTTINRLNWTKTMQNFMTISTLSLVISISACSTSEKRPTIEDSANENANEDSTNTDNPSTIEDTSGQTTEDTEDTDHPDTDSGETRVAVYCEGNDPTLANCDPERTYDPWTAHGGEVHYWIRDAKTEVYPFTVIHDPAIWYGYLQLTTGERVRDQYTEDIFHVWFSETPNGPVLDGNADCEYYSTQAHLYFYWKQDNQDPQLDDICYIGTQERVLYLNYETRCMADFYEGLCDDNNKQKSTETYQFDVSRRIKIE